MNQLNFRTDPKNLVHTFKRLDNSTFRLSGMSKQIEVGDTVVLPYEESYKDEKYLFYTSEFLVSEVTERRDHRGVFENKDDAKDAFFIANVSPVNFKQKKLNQ